MHVWYRAQSLRLSPTLCDSRVKCKLWTSPQQSSFKFSQAKLKPKHVHPHHTRSCIIYEAYLIAIRRVRIVWLSQSGRICCWWWWRLRIKSHVHSVKTSTGPIAFPLESVFPRLLRIRNANKRRRCKERGSLLRLTSVPRFRKNFYMNLYLSRLTIERYRGNKRSGLERNKSIWWVCVDCCE